jgi:hypothetical protein
MPWAFFLEGEVSHGDHGLGSLVELCFKAPPGTSYSYITIHHIGTTLLRLVGVPTSEVGYTSATTGRGDHEVYKGHVVALERKSLVDKNLLHYKCRILYGHLHENLKSYMMADFLRNSIYSPCP